jgi:hypothetical protein
MAETNTQQILGLQTTLIGLLENRRLTVLGRSNDGEESFFKVWNILNQERHLDQILGRSLARRIAFERTILRFRSYSVT